MEKLKNSFVIVIPVYNCEEFIHRSFYSVVSQVFPDLGIIIRDDQSTDSTPFILEQILGIDGVTENYAKFHGKDVLFIRNQHKFYGGGNTYDSARKYISNRSAIVGVVDGDDWLTDAEAAAKIFDVYASRKVWQVWSQHQANSLALVGRSGFSSELPDDLRIYQDRNYWSVSHFRTCLAWLYDYVREEDLYDPFERKPFCKFAADAANIYPISELCGKAKSFFLDEVLYFYNDNLTTNEVSISQDSVSKYSRYIRDKTIYRPMVKV